MSNKRTAHPSGFVQGAKKFFLSAFVVLTFIAYLLHERHATLASANSGNSGLAGNPPASNGAISTAGSASQGGLYKNGTYTGPTVDAFYGLVQVQVLIQNGKIANVQFLQYPNDRRTSVEINTQVMPWLTQEAIQADSANVDIITGATLTSEAFATSLQAALQSARN